MYLLFLVVSIILSCIIIALLYPSIDWIQCLTLGSICFFCTYVIVSGFLFAVDIFSLKNALVTTSVVQMSFCIILYYFYGKNKIHIIPSTNTYLGLIILIMVALPLTGNKFDFWGMGQDEGVYQTKAINLVYNLNDNQIDFNEFYQLKNESDASQFAKLIKDILVGFNNYDHERAPLQKEKQLSIVSGVYHGIPTFPAMLALVGKILGISNMMQVQTIFYIQSIILIYMICLNLKLNKYSCFLASFIFSISPVVIWVSKSSLTEMFLCCIFLSYIYLLTDTENKVSNYLLWIPIATFSFYHVSIYTVMPLFILIFSFLIITIKNKFAILLSSILSLIFYILGFITMIYSSTTYTYDNYSRIYFLSWINDSTLFYIILLLSLLSAVILFLIYKYNKMLYNILSKINYKYVLQILFITFLLLCVYYGFKIGFTAPIKSNNSSLTDYYYGKGLVAFKQLTITAYIYASSGFIFLVVFLTILLRPKQVLISKNRIIILLFMYTVMFYSAVLNKEVIYYYYYSRYIVPYIPIIAILGAICLNKFYKIIPLVCILSLFIGLPYIKPLIYEKDDNRLDWIILNNFSEIIHKDDIVLVDPDLMNVFYLPLKAMTKASIYPNIAYNNSNFLNNINGNIYTVTANSKFMHLNNFIEKQVITNHYSHDDAYYRDGLVGYPKYFNKKYDTIHLLQKIKTVYEYNFKQENSFYHSNFSGLEDDFKWSINGNSSIQLMISDIANYKLNVFMKEFIPFDKIKNLQIGFYFNSKLISEMELKQNRPEITLTIDKNLIKDGVNLLEIKYIPWRPAEYGINDERALGLALEKITLNKLED